MAMEVEPKAVQVGIPIRFADYIFHLAICYITDGIVFNTIFI